MNQKTLSGIIIILVLIVGIMTGLYIFKTNTTQPQPAALSAIQPATDQPASEPPITTPAPQQPAANPVITPQDTSIVYTNSDFGFKLTFPIGWEKYKISLEKDPSQSGVTYIYVLLPTADKKAGGHYMPSTGKTLEGYQSLFAITAWEVATWNKEKAACVKEPNPGCPNEASVLAKTAKYVFDYSTPNGVPASDLETIRNTVNRDFMEKIFKLLD